MISSMAKSGAQKAPWFMASVLFLAAFMNLLDATIVNLALPEIQHTLNASSAQLQWIMVVYIVSFAAGLLPFGRFGDLFGRDRMFLWGLVAFLISSAACGFASSIELLIAYRVLQGFASAMMVPQVLAIIHATFPAESKGKAIGFYGMISALGAVAGPLVGGFLISANLLDLGWRLIFLINIPLGFVAMIGALFLVPKVRATNRISPDWFGTVLFAFIIIGLIFPLIEGSSYGWPVWMIGLMLCSAGLAVWFVQRQKQLEGQGRVQTLPVNLMADGFFVSGLAAVTAFSAGIAGVFVMMAILLQSGLDYSAAETGLALVPHPASAMVASLLTGRLGPRWFDARIGTGALSLLLGMIWLYSVLSGVGGALNSAALVGPFVLIGTGMGTTIVALFQVTLSRVANSDAGAGSGILQTFQQIGIALSIAVIGQIFFSHLGVDTSQLTYVNAAQTALLLPILIYAVLSALYLYRAVLHRDGVISLPR